MESIVLQATAVVRNNSIAFVEQVFSLYEARQPFVLVTSEEQAAHLPGIAIDRCIVPAEQSGWFDTHHALIHDDLPAQVSYTSGTEGQPKGILLTYANLADVTERVIEQMEMTAEIREYVGVPATFSFGMARYRATSAVGGRAYLPPNGFDPLELGRMLGAGEVNALSAVPTLLRILLASPTVIGEVGKKLRWMEIGSQYMTADEKRRVREMFPNATIVQHYGLTEASRSTFLQISGAPDDVLDTIGRPVGQTEVQIGDDGRIRIRGPHVAKSRIDADGLKDLQDPDGWLQTNDLGHMRDGYLIFDGRADDLINCGGMKIVPDQLEEGIRTRLPLDAQIAVVKVPDDQRGDGVLVAAQIDPSDTSQIHGAAVAALREMGIDAGGSLHVFAVDALPLTGTGKVQRAVLAEQFLAQRSKDLADQESSASKTGLTGNKVRDVLSLFRHEFPGQLIEPDDSFETLGGDSLHYIQFSLSFERRFGQLPTGWEALSTAELQQYVGSNRKTIWRRLESATMTRAFFMICIVALHTDAFIYSQNWGAAYFLILLAGYSVARFQLPEIIRSNSTRTLWGTIKSVAIPTVMMVAFLQVATQKFEILPLLLISNFLNPATLTGFTFYFVEFYIQLLVLAALLLSVKRVREAFRRAPMVSAVALLVAVAIIDNIIGLFWDVDYNFRRTPWNYAWAFALGMVLASATDRRSQLVAIALSIIAVAFEWGATSAAFYVAGGCVIMLFVRAFIVPAPVKILVAEVAGASLFIYLSHYQMIILVNKVFGENRPWLELALSVVVGVVLAHMYAWLERRFLQFKPLPDDLLR